MREHMRRMVIAAAIVIAGWATAATVEAQPEYCDSYGSTYCFRWGVGSCAQEQYCTSYQYQYLWWATYSTCHCKYFEWYWESKPDPESPCSVCAIDSGQYC